MTSLTQCKFDFFSTAITGLIAIFLQNIFKKTVNKWSQTSSKVRTDNERDWFKLELFIHTFMFVTVPQRKLSSFIIVYKWHNDMQIICV